MSKVKKTTLLRNLLIALMAIVWLVQVFQRNASSPSILVILIVATTPIIYWRLFRYVNREKRRALDPTVNWQAEPTTSDNESAVVYSVLASLYIFDKESAKSDFPTLRIRTTLLARLGGNRGGGRLEIRRDGLFFRARPFPLSVGVRGSLSVPWSGVRSVSVLDPTQGLSSLGGQLSADLIQAKTKIINFEFLGSQDAVKVALRSAGAPIG